MRNNSISWKEGMFLLPHHFQRQEIFFEHQMACGAKNDSPFSYGFRELEIDANALDEWQLVVNKAVGRTKSGTLFEFADGEIPRADLKKLGDGKVQSLLEKNQTSEIYLSFPINKPNEKNISPGEEKSRYHEFEEAAFDLHSGGNERDLVYKKLRGVLSADQDRNLDYEYLPIAKFELGATASGQVPRIAEQFIPPSTLSMGNHQARVFYRQMANELSAYLKLLGEYLRANGSSLSMISDPEIGDTMFRFIQLSELRGWLLAHNRSPGANPFQNFQFLCQTIGRLVLVDPNQEWLVDYSAYDHDDLYQSMNWAWGRIQRCMVPPRDSNRKRLEFIAETMRTEAQRDEIVWKCTIPREMFESNWDLYFCVDVAFGKMPVTDQKKFINKLFENQALFQWKLGSHERINNYFINVEKGVTHEPFQREKHNLPRKKGWVYSDIMRDEYWDAVKQSGTICFRVDQDNLRTPMSDLGSEMITVGIEQRTYQFRVSIWAIKNG